MNLVSKQIFDFFYTFFSHLLLSHNALNLTYLIVQISCFDIPSTHGQKVLKIYEKRKPSFFMLSRTGSDLFFQIFFFIFKVEFFLKGSLDSIPLPSPSVKIKIMCGKV